MALKPASKDRLFTRSVMRERGEIEERRTEILSTTVIPLSTREEFAREISSLWADAQKRFIAIGRYLANAKTRLPRGEFEAMVDEDLPFGKNVAYQLRRVAEAVEQGRLREPELPPSYNTIYYLSTLSDGELEKARAKGIVRPDVTVHEVKAFKQSMLRNATGLKRQSVLLRRRDRIIEKMDQLKMELKEIERELGPTTIEGTLAKPGTDKEAGK